MTASRSGPRAPRVPGRRNRRPGDWLSWLFAAPAALMYAGFVLLPLALTVQYSFYDWNGITASTWVGLDNYRRLFTEPALFGTIVHAFELILFFSVIPVLLGLLVATTNHNNTQSRLALAARTVLFLPRGGP